MNVCFLFSASVGLYRSSWQLFSEIYDITECLKPQAFVPV